MPDRRQNHMLRRYITENIAEVLTDAVRTTLLTGLKDKPVWSDPHERQLIRLAKRLTNMSGTRLKRTIPMSSEHMADSASAWNAFFNHSGVFENVVNAPQTIDEYKKKYEEQMKIKRDNEHD